MSESIADILERTAGEPGGEAQPPDHAAPPQDPADDAAQAADDLRRQLAEQTNRAQAAERARQAADARVAEVTAEAATTRQTAAEANYTTILSALDARTRESEALTAELEAAGEKGEFRRIAEISARLGRVGAAIEGLESAKQQMEGERQTRLREPPKPAAPPAPAPAADTVVGVSREQFLANPTLNPRVADWIRGHDQFFTDAAFNRKCMAADALVQADGITPSHPEYLTRVERIIGLDQQRQPPRQANAPPAGAPPSRQPPSMSGRPAPSGDVYISPEARRLASWMDIDPAGYQQEEARLRASGEIPHRRR